MLRIMWNGVSGMAANQEKLDAISNNIANYETTGYKSQDVSFSDLLYGTLNKNGYSVSSGKSPIAGSGVKADEATRDNSEGTPTETDLNTDLCIDGEGYFRVTTQDGSKAYERAGNFKINSQGKLTDANGNFLDIDYSVDPNSVKFTDKNLVVASDGEVGIKGDNNQITRVGKINLYDAVGDDSMVSVGNNLYVPRSGAQIVAAPTNTDIMQGYLEGSNVDLATEMTDMIIAQRAYEMSSKSVKTADQMWSLVNGMNSK